MEMNIYQVDAFTSNPFCGNPAGVVPDAKGISKDIMQKIAYEINLSETAFVEPLSHEDFNVCFFTPICEVDLCGHATIATFYTLAKEGYIRPVENGIKTVYQITRAGRLPVEIKFTNNKVDYIIMEQAPPKSLGIVEDINPLLKTMGIGSSEIGTLDKSLKPEIISTGLSDIILPIRNKKTIDNLGVDFSKLTKISKELNVTGVHGFFLPEENSKIVYTRNFAPLVGINEEAATGTSNGALIYYLKKNNLIKDNSILSLQGESLKRPSEIMCFYEEVNDKIKIKVGGKARIVIDGIINF